MVWAYDAGKIFSILSMSDGFRSGAQAQTYDKKPDKSASSCVFKAPDGVFKLRPMVKRPAGKLQDRSSLLSFNCKLFHRVLKRQEIGIHIGR